VTFGGTATVEALPTLDRAPIRAALAQLQFVPRTAIGEAIFASLDAIRSVPADHRTRPPGRILLLSDGATNTGRSNDSAAQAAAAQHVAVSTIAFGTAAGTVNIGGTDVNVAPEPDALAQIAQATGGHAATATSAQALHAVYAGLRDAVINTTAQREVTAWFTGAALALALAAIAASLLWLTRLP
jgi:Ca-activated chloride channel family protein